MWFPFNSKKIISQCVVNILGTMFKLGKVCMFLNAFWGFLSAEITFNHNNCTKRTHVTVFLVSFKYTISFQARGYTPESYVAPEGSFANEAFPTEK